MTGFATKGQVVKVILLAQSRPEGRCCEFDMMRWEGNGTAGWCQLVFLRIWYRLLYELIS